jgi:hypothetical protein
LNAIGSSVLFDALELSFAFVWSRIRAES